MSVKNKISKILADLGHYESKLEGVFKTTYIDRIIHNAFTSPNVVKSGLGYYPEEMVKTYMAGTLFQAESQPDLISLLKENSSFKSISGFSDDIPVQSTFSRAFNNNSLHNPLDATLTNLQRLIGLKHVHKYSDINPVLMKAISNGYLPTSIDSSHISLSTKKYNFSTRGYSGSKKKTLPGAKILLSLDTSSSIPINYDIGTGKTHESSILDPLVNEINSENIKNFERSIEKELNLLIMTDKGLWKQSRFKKWNEEQIYFIIPFKRNSFKTIYPNLNDEIKSGNENREWIITIPNSTTPLRLVRVFTGRRKNKRFLLLTNVWNMSIEDITELYRNRWTIETVFKWLKKYLNLEKPLGTSWNAFIFHIYCVIAMWTVLLYFLILIGFPSWQENLQNLRRQLVNGVEKKWNFISFGVLIASLNENFEEWRKI